MPTFVDGEAALSVFNKLNTAINRTERVMIVDDVTQLANLVYDLNSQWGVSAGMQVLTAKEGFLYDVLASDASTFDNQPGAVKLDALPGADGSINFRAMLPAANGTTDDYPLLAKLLAKPVNGVLSVYFPSGNYRMNSTIDLKRVVRFWGDAGFANQSAGRLTFAADLHGIVINRFNTIAGGVESPTTTFADGSVIDGLQIWSAGGTDRTKAGIWLRARGTIRNTYVRGFPGNGIQVIAGAGAGGAAEGNANCFRIESCTCSQNRNHGFYADGADANAGFISLLDCNSNGRFGIYDSSFLGNTYAGCHTATNGVATVGGNSAIQGSIVLHNGNFWLAHWNATEAQLVATTPGTNSNVWIDRGAGYSTSIYPAWQAGQPEGTYFRAFAYFNEAPTAESVFIGCYNEMDADAAFLGPCLVIGGLMSNIRTGDKLGAGTNGQYNLKSLSTSQGTHTVRTTDGTAFFTMIGGDGNNETWRWKRNSNGTLRFDNANSDLRQVFFITGPAETNPYKFSVAEFLLAGRLHGGATSAPATGTGVAGEVRWNTAGTRGQPWAWMRTNDGTWQPLGLIP